MSLNYRLTVYGKDGTPDELLIKARYDGYSDFDKKFYHESLPWMLMLVDIGRVQTKSIPHIVARLKVADNAYGDDWSERMCEALKSVDSELTFAKYLERFIGFGCNVATTSSKEFKKKISSHIFKDLPKMTEDESADLYMERN